MSPEVKKERSGWRDQWLSARHRLWGWDCPWQDVDWLEYDNGHPVALFEYKQASAPPLNESHLGARALIELGNMAGLPVFGVRYFREPVGFLICGLNAAGRRLALDGHVCEVQYVEWLYALRGRNLPPDVRSIIVRL